MPKNLVPKRWSAPLANLHIGGYKFAVCNLDHMSGYCDCIKQLWRCACFNFPPLCSFRCGIEYHAPTDCDVIKKWLTKCADDSETANYISAHTKDVSFKLIGTS